MCSKKRAKRYILNMKNTLFALASFAVALAFSTAGFAAPQVIDTELKDGSRDRNVPIKVRVPDGSGKAPLVIFSHGLGGSREGGKAWGEHWSANGYLVVHIQHLGSDESVWKTAGEGEPRQRLRAAATPEQLVGRVDDVRFLIAEIERAQKSDIKNWTERADLSRIAMTGHSFGAHTTMALAGQRYPGPVKTLDDSRIKAFIALSPNASGQPRSYADRYGSMTAPFLSITGTHDGDVFAENTRSKSAVEKRKAVFEHQPAGNAYLLVLNDADHMVFNGNEAQTARESRHSTPLSNDQIKRIHSAVKDTSLKFLDAYLRSDAAAKTWLKQDAAKALESSGEWKTK
jgi:predicted dienelactone hydrolase